MKSGDLHPIERRLVSFFGCTDGALDGGHDLVRLSDVKLHLLDLPAELELDGGGWILKFLVAFITNDVIAVGTLEVVDTEPCALRAIILTASFNV